MDQPEPSPSELAGGVHALPGALRYQFSRGGGPGGQNVNKLNTKAEIWVPISAIIGLTDRARDRLTALAGHRLTQAGEIHIASDTHRTQRANREAVFERPLRDARPMWSRTRR